MRQIALVLACVLLLTACRQQIPASSEIHLDVAVTGLQVGEAQISVRARDKNGATIDNPGAIVLRGDMDHAGMAPVFAEARAALDGVFTLPFEWTMAGAWILEAKLSLDSGEEVVETFHYEILAQAADNEMSELERAGGEPSAMEVSGHSMALGESSAAYMRIQNNGAADATITAARSDAAQLVEFHRSVVADDIARMEKIERLVIPAGEALELRPGDLHIMLRGLKSDLKPGTSISLQLELASGATLPMTIPITNMLMDDDQGPTALGDLVFSKLWARPASAGGTHENQTHEPAHSH